jgi:hypothetical protein
MDRPKASEARRAAGQPGQRGRGADVRCGMLHASLTIGLRCFV